MANKEYNYTEELKKLEEFKKSLKEVKDFLNSNKKSVKEYKLYLFK